MTKVVYDLEALCALSREERAALETVIVGHGALRDEAAVRRLGDALADCRRLRTLHLWPGGNPAVSFELSEADRARVGAALGARVLPPSVRGTLTLLNLSSNALGDEGAAALAPALAQCTSLEGLDLHVRGTRREPGSEPELSGVPKSCTGLGGVRAGKVNCLFPLRSRPTACASCASGEGKLTLRGELVGVSSPRTETRPPATRS